MLDVGHLYDSGVIILKPSTFIGCSTEALNVAYEIQTQVGSVSEATVWNQGLFAPGDVIINRIIEIADSFDFAIFVFSEDDTANIRGQDWLIARDNTIFESGMFAAKIGIERTFIITPSTRQVKLPSDIQGVVYSTYDPKARSLPATIATACHPIRSRISDFGCFRSKLRISGGQSYLLTAMSNEEEIAEDKAVSLLMRYNSVKSPSEGEYKAWRKATYYCVETLKQLDLINERAVSIRFFKITDKGSRYVERFLTARPRKS